MNDFFKKKQEIIEKLQVLMKDAIDHNRNSEFKSLGSAISLIELAKNPYDIMEALDQYGIQKSDIANKRHYYTTALMKAGVINQPQSVVMSVGDLIVMYKKLTKKK